MSLTYDELREAGLRAVLKDCSGSVSRTAAALRVSRATVYRWMKRYGIDLDAYRA